MGLAGVAAIGWPGSGGDRKVDFSLEIAPLLKAKCVSCHGSQSPAAGLNLSSPEGIKKGGVSGKVVEAGKSDKSLLVRRIRGRDGKAQMPMGFAPLPEASIKKVEAWIDQGAEFGAGTSKHWSYVPPRRPNLPSVSESNWGRNAVDRFILSRLDRAGLKPSPEAPKEILARRLYLDLTGLPPTVEELEAFLNDRRPDAYERLVERLLASPHYGEKMARAWLDLARYADTNGYEKDLPRQMWLWRDWVIRAFNANMPYDRFTIEQLAGDLLPNPTPDQLIATGFHRNSMLNDEGGIDPEEFRVVAVMDRVDATATTWLGTTLACAQCHDHKYEPISQRDYYRFYAFFNQSEDNGRDKDPVLKVPNPDQQRRRDALEADLAKARQEIIDRTPNARANAEDWASRYRESWKVLRPEKWNAQATLTRLSDGSLLASGADPVEDRYVVTYSLDPGPFIGIRLEAIPDPSLPEGSSGRNFNGNFVLRKLEAEIVSPGGERREIKFAEARADFVQGGHDPMSVIEDGDRPGWAIAGFEPKNRVLHALNLRLTAPVAAKTGDVLVVRYIHQSRHANHNLGRFRLSSTDDLELASQAPPGAAVRAALNQTKRTPSDAEAVAQFYLSIAPELAPYRARAAEDEQKLKELDAEIPTTLILRERTKPRLDRMLIRGDFRTPGSPVLPGVPLVMGGFAPTANRLGLARWLVDRKNPLTARVEVNRLWQQVFGRGLVATPEDFGVQGEPPSHPELLDWLAVEFMDSGWDIKRMIRLLVTSSTYRQSAQVTSLGATKDPENLLLGRSPRYRVDAEGVRDVALKASGRLTDTIGGPSVMPPQPPGVWENSFTFYDTKDRWVDDEGPNRYRRGLYTFWRRTAPFPMALNFDLKTRDVCTAKRSRTNTPLQALNTLNDPLFVECAGALGQEMMRVSERARMRAGFRPGPPNDMDKGDDVGLVYGFRACTSRAPKAADLARLRDLLRQSRRHFAEMGGEAAKLLRAARIDSPSDLTNESAAWTVAANTLLNLDETLTRG